MHNTILFTINRKIKNINKKNFFLLLITAVTKVWSKLPVQGTLPLARHGHSVSVIGTKMYVFGGQHVGRYLNDLVAFDIKTRKWNFLNKLVKSSNYKIFFFRKKKKKEKKLN
jgi:hypothetical protein